MTQESTTVVLDDGGLAAVLGYEDLAAVAAVAAVMPRRNL